MILLLETVLGPLLVWLFVGEVPGGYAVLGGGAVILTVLFLHSLPERMSGDTPVLHSGACRDQAISSNRTGPSRPRMK